LWNGWESEAVAEVHVGEEPEVMRAVLVDRSVRLTDRDMIPLQCRSDVRPVAEVGLQEQPPVEMNRIKHPRPNAEGRVVEAHPRIAPGHLIVMGLELDEDVQILRQSIADTKARGPRNPDPDAGVALRGTQIESARLVEVQPLSVRHLERQS